MTDMANMNRRADDPGFDPSMGDSRQLVRRRPELAKADSDQVVALWHEHKLRSAGVGAELRTQQYYYPFDVQGIDGQTLADELVAAREPFSDRAEEFRALRRSLLSGVFSDAVKRAVAVVSAEEGVGKTYMVANLAVSFSQFTGRTLLIDANLRQPRLHRLHPQGTEERVQHGASLLRVVQHLVGEAARLGGDRAAPAEQPAFERKPRFDAKPGFKKSFGGKTGGFKTGGGF